MSWKYRPDELNIYHGVGVSTTARNEPALYVNDSNGELTFNAGAGSTTHTPVGANNYEVLAAARVLTAADSGKRFYLALAGGFDITLPALTTANFWCEFIASVSPTTSYTITGATADKIYGLVLSSSGAAEDTAGVGDPGDVINFVGGTALIGDRVRVDCNGTFYLVEGRCAAAGGITITG